MEVMEKRVSELEDRSTEVIQSEELKKKIGKKRTQTYLSVGQYLYV